MKPKPQPLDVLQLFQAHFGQILNAEHPLMRLADRIDWPRFDVAFADSYSEDLGAPGKAIRLMVGLQYLTLHQHHRRVSFLFQGRLLNRLGLTLPLHRRYMEEVAQM